MMGLGIGNTRHCKQCNAERRNEEEKGECDRIRWKEGRNGRSVSRVESRVKRRLSTTHKQREAATVNNKYGVRESPNAQSRDLVAMLMISKPLATDFNPHGKESQTRATRDMLPLPFFFKFSSYPSIHHISV